MEFWVKRSSGAINVEQKKFCASHISAWVAKVGGEGKGLLAKVNWSLQVWEGARVGTYVSAFTLLGSNRVIQGVQ